MTVKLKKNDSSINITIIINIKSVRPNYKAGSTLSMSVIHKDTLLLNQPDLADCHCDKAP